MPSITHLSDYLDYHARNSPAKPALITDSRSISWRELGQETAAAAANLEAILQPSGQKQRVIGILLPNDWRFVIAYLAILKTGHIALPLDPSYKPMEIDVIVGQIPPVAIISDASGSQAVQKHQSLLVMFDHLQSSVRSSRLKSAVRLTADKQIASLLFTSGTTGRPKAATYSHSNHLWNVEVCSRLWRWDARDSLLISLRLSHWYGLVMGLSGALYHGNRLYLQEWFEPRQTLEALSSGKITLFQHVPHAYMEMLRVKNGDYDLSGVRLCISGGAPLPPASWRRFNQKYRQKILECYGSTESGRIAANTLGERIPGSPGRLLEGVKVMFDPKGEILIKSPGVFPGYYKNPAATRASYRDGWWRTGDLGRLENGRLILYGRLQEKIRKQGYNISPRDIEWALHQNPKIKDAYVLGLQIADSPDDKLVYFVVGDLSDRELGAFCRANLLFAWRPDQVIRLKALPRTLTGKPKLAILKEMARKKT